ncbi:hypothetical protein [Amycolatopsis sp. cg9]
MSGSPIRLLLADDHPVVRAVLVPGLGFVVARSVESRPEVRR